MDEETGELGFGEIREDGLVEESLTHQEALSCNDVVYSGSENNQHEWIIEPQSSLNDSESEDILHAINPNEMYSSGATCRSISESDSGLSEDHYFEAPQGPSEPAQSLSVPTVYQVVYDISTPNSIKTEPEQQNVDVISIELDEWSSQMLISESYIINELPLVSAVKVENPQTVTSVPNEAHCPESLPVYPELLLTEEEQKLLNQEGISLPNNLPLTKAEERILKKVRRKIRNKQSAQDSRRRKKEYVDGLESRVATCSTQNKELQRTVEQLEKHNISLMAQLHKLQALIKQTATKSAQTSTCILIIIFSLALIIFPSYGPFSWNSASLEEGYAPKGVISRNILNDPASSMETSEDIDNEKVLPDPLGLPPDVSQSDPPGEISEKLQQSSQNQENDMNEALATEYSNHRNKSTLADGQSDALTFGLMSAAGQGSASIDTVKPAHADEM
ncbi:cyclic AMP-responsive element-binding protein 3-like protein 4 [Chanos chanos]|uniref:Cyclic AMP-responsive element-binding protein 3-like protein 4 n=1 Tax=Chanos chanos TaxID=29144 RepID=A0A6J2W1M3_CHACN|nr:cyclic AMP-responsive element-binding protein 3-like protein 4 [Chanos chanos]